MGRDTGKKGSCHIPVEVVQSAATHHVLHLHFSFAAGTIAPVDVLCHKHNWAIMLGHSNKEA